MIANHKRLGNSAFERKHYKEAIAYYEKAVNLEPTEMDCWDSLALVLMEAGAFREVVSLILKT